MKNRLAKYYDDLEPAERLSLIQAASLRGDQVEYQDLVQSSPMIGWQLPSHYGPGIALQQAGAWHVQRQAELLCTYWHCRCLMATHRNIETPETKQQAEIINQASLLASYRYYLFQDAWSAFCQTLDVNPQASTMGFASDVFSKGLEILEPPRNDELARKVFGEKLQTQESAVAGYREYFDHISSQWR